MAEGVEIVVPPNLPRLLARLLVAVFGMVGGLLLVVGPGRILTLVAEGCGGLAVLAFIVAILRQRPRMVITPKGFTVHALFGDESHEWQDVRGRFAVIKLGFANAVGDNLTADCKTRTGTKPTSAFSGYDAAISGAFALSAEELAGLLNAHHPAEAGSHAAAGDETEMAAHAPITPEAQAEGDGNPILRAAAGVLALLFAGTTPWMVTQGGFRWDGAVAIVVLASMFGWYAARGRNGLPQFLTKR